MGRSWAAAASFTLHLSAHRCAGHRAAAGPGRRARAARRNHAASATIFAGLKALGVVHVFGLSSQDTYYQREVADRLHLPFPLLSDAELKFMRALDLPTFSVAGMILLKRMALIIDDGVTAKVFYPVFPPDQSATEVVSWLPQSPR
jgi:hypothetical protein